MKMTIHELRKAGAKCKIRHFRYWGVQKRILSAGLVPLKELKQKKESIFARGGQTIIEVIFPNGETYRSKANCSLEDNFNRKIAINICLGRIKKQIEKDGFSFELLLKKNE